MHTSNKIFTIFLVGFFLSRFAFHSHAAETTTPPSTEIGNDEIKIAIYLPDAEKGYYRGSRFDWSGLIQRVDYKGHSFFGDWKTTHDPLNYEDANGTASEFSMTSPLGYAEAAPGEDFIKIGIGKLRRIDRSAYLFSTNYKVSQPFPWEIEQGKDWIEFRQTASEFRGFAYQYVKRIEIDSAKPVFTISHTLKNTGSKKIETDHYCHNFTIIDDDPIGVHYRLEFPFGVKARRSLKGIAETRDKQLVFVKNLTTGSLFTELDGPEPIPEHNDFIIRNVQSDASIHIQGDKAPYKINFYAAPLAVCPEPFIEIVVDPGQTYSWRDTYTLNAASAASADSKSMK